MKAVFMVALAIGVAIGVAPPAAADEGTYLQQLVPRFPFIEPNQLVTEGYKVCHYVVGRPSSDGIAVVQKDLAVSVPVALDIVAAAVEELTC